MFNVFKGTRINKQETERVFILKLIELGVRRTKTYLKQIPCYDKMVESLIAQKSSEVDTDLHNIGMDMIALFRVTKEEK